MLATAVAAALGLTQLPALNGGHSPATAQHRTAPKLLDEDAAVAKARSAGKRVEVTALRDASTTTWARPDGSFELEARTVAFRAKVDGVWRPIDTRLRRTKSGGWAPAAVNNPVAFSGGSRSDEHASRAQNRSRLTAPATGQVSGTDLVTLTTDGHQLKLTWPGPLPEPVIEGARALYQEVLPGVDLLLTARDSGFSHLLIVKTAQAVGNPALAELSYGLSSPDLTFTLDPGSRIVQAKDTSGHEIAVSPTPYMWDSAGKLAVTEGDDPQPPRPSDDPLPEADPSVNPPGDPNEAPDDNATPDSDYDNDTAPPEPEPAAAKDQASRTLRTARAAAINSGSGAQSVLSLDGLAGPQPGSHDAIAAGTLTDGSTLTIKPNRGLLTDEDTVFPVFIDPSFTGHTNNWTTAYEPYPSSSFWNGTNFNDGTDTARVGYESTTRGLSRSFFQLQLSSKLKGAAVSSGDFYAKETYSWSCSARNVEVWRTGSISSGTTWNKQPSWIEQVAAQNVAHGYNSSCPDNWVKFNTTSLAQDAADAGWGSTTLGLRADDEGSPYPWKKFEASSSESPYLKIIYNRKPNEPTKQTMTPGPDCDTTTPYPSVGKSDLTFAATASDPDGDLRYLDFEVWHSTDAMLTDGNRSVDAGGHANVTVPASKFINGTTYYWRVRAIDSTGAASSYAPPGTGNCGFVYDASRPSSPSVDSADFPEDDGTGTVWSTVKLGTSGTAVYGASGSTDTVKYEYSYNNTSYNHSVPTTGGASVTVTLTPPVAGPNVLYIRAVDTAGNTSEAFKYLYYVTPRDAADGPGDVTGDRSPDLFVIDQFGDLRLYPAPSNGDIDASVPAAHSDGHILADDDAYDTYWSGALITHNGDFLPGDGLTDLVARMNDGKLYLYRGDGYGSINIKQRAEVLLPDRATTGETVPSPAAFDQILAAGDLDHDGRPDLLATAGTQYWAFLGYTAGAFTQAILQNDGAAWLDRDLVSIGDHNKDNCLDLVYRVRTTGTLWLRYGKPASNGGTSLPSLATSGGSLNGIDTTYATTGWNTSTVRLLTGGPDVNLDGIPDIWAVMNDTYGTVRFYRGGTTTIGAYTTVVSNGWNEKQALG
ncbi:DNRLRE domain-containing protein [Actinacidiphila glaucinigra]|uniref:DNRLRE domain-containing protein n=1 Tax=Actinacidiphila glaucinigra TaxID=235986 RepID=UPI003408947C